MPNGALNAPYAYTVATSGSPAPTISTPAGSLPPGLTLNGTTGVVAGTPTTANTYLGTLTATNGTPPDATQAFSVTISAGTTQIELHTDKNQTLAKLQKRLASTEDGRTVLRGSVPLDFRTTDRVVVLNLPGQPQRLFKLRLAANPGHSDQFGPWHLVDRVASPGSEPARELNDAFAIRYRVL